GSEPHRGRHRRASAARGVQAPGSRRRASRCPVKGVAFTVVAAALALAPAARVEASSVAIVGVSLDKVIAGSDVVLVGRVVSLGSQRYPAAEAPADAGRGLAYLAVDVEETLRPARGGGGGPQAGARVQIFDPGQKYAYEMADRIKAGVVSYEDPRY